MTAGGEAEVCVIGGGPAGSTIARKLASLGHRVSLIERAVFPRHHLGESLAPSILPLLDVLGLREAIEQADFLRPERVHIRWSAATDQKKSRTAGPGFQVDRGAFDRLLLDAARDAGANVLQPCLIPHRPKREGGRWSVPVQWNDRTGAVVANVLVDASGRSSILQGARARYGVATLALYGYWRDTGLSGPETRVEAGPHEWFWGAPLPDGTVNATVFVDQERCVRAGRAGIERLYRSLLANSALLSSCLDGRLTSRIGACDASAYLSDLVVDDHTIRVGEAACAIDPLSSQGVQTAMRSALQGAIVVHTLLACPANATSALEFYRRHQTDTARRNHAWAAECYAQPHAFSGHDFWRRRAQPTPGPATATEWPRNEVRLSPDDRVALSRAARLADTPTIKGELVVSLPSLVHPALERPVAYLGNTEVTPLLRDVGRGATARQVVSRWSQRLPLEESWRIMTWLWSRGIVVPAGGG